MEQKHRIITELKNISAVILAGGYSSRMDYPKLWLDYENDVSFVEQIINTYQSIGCSDIVVVVNNEFTTGFWQEKYEKINHNIKVVKNFHPEKGRFYSLQLGLKGLTLTNSYTFIHNVDNPFVSSDLLVKLISSKSIDSYVSPQYLEKVGHPTLVAPSIVNDAKNNDSEIILKKFLSNYEQLKVGWIDNSINVNINDMTTYKQYLGSTNTISVL